MKEKKILSTLLLSFLMIVFCRANVSASTTLTTKSGAGTTANPYVLTQINNASLVGEFILPTSTTAMKTGSSGYTYYKITNSSSLSRKLTIAPTAAANYSYFTCGTSTSSFNSYTNPTIAANSTYYFRLNNTYTSNNITLTFQRYCTKCSSIVSSDAVHSSSHTSVKYVSTSSSQHNKYCATCQEYGHGDACTYLGAEAHNLTTVVMDGYQYEVCQDCSYQKKGDCTHSSTEVYSAGNTSSYCGIRCSICKTDLTSTKKRAHTFGSMTKTEDGHEWKCTNCGYTKFSNCNYVTTYKQTGYVTVKSIGKIPNFTSHNVIKTCTICGKSYTEVTTDLHSFSGWKCSKCGYTKGTKLAAPKVKSAKQSGKRKSKKVTTKAYWKWDSVWNRWLYYKSRTYTKYTYKVAVKWNKVKNAKGYIVSTTKPKAGALGYNLTKGLSKTVSYTGTKKLSKLKVYVAAVNSKGVICNIATKTVKVK